MSWCVPRASPSATTGSPSSDSWSQCGAALSLARTSDTSIPCWSRSRREWATTTLTPPLSCRSLTRKATFTRSRRRAAWPDASRRYAAAVGGAPTTDRPWRLVFAGAPNVLQCAADAPGTFGEATPDVAVVFDPSEGPPAGPVDAGAVTVAYLTRPATGADLTRFDRILVADRRLAAELGDGAVAWRAVPLPVADRFFDRAVAPDPAAGPLVVGGSERDRRRVLRDHASASPSAEPWIAINLHDDRDGGFEHRVAVQLAAGRLVLSEPLHPRHGL